MVSDRGKYVTRSFLLRDAAIKEHTIAAIRNAPEDDERPIEVVIREQVKARKPDQNALMWVGPLADIAAQAYVDGRLYAADVWHEHFKREHLPEEFDPELCKEGYRKWSISPSGNRVLVGSTTQLTVKGFSEYLEKVHADGGNLGVRFHTNPRDRSLAA